MMSPTTIKAVLFDLGETLIRYGRINKVRAFAKGARGSHHFLKTHNRSVQPYPLFFLENALRLRWETLRSHWTGKDFDVLDLFERVGARKGIHLNPSQWEELAWQWYEPLSRDAVIERGTARTLEALLDMGLKLGLLSNTFVPASCLDRHLAQVGLLEFLPVRLYSYQYPYRKPDPRIFKVAADRLGERIEHVLYVGDRIDGDILPALSLGMAAALVPAYTNAGRAVPQGAWALKRLSDLPNLIPDPGTSAKSSFAEE